MIDEHYENTYKQLTMGKDSIFEPCKIISFDVRTMTAHVYFLRSTREKEDAIVLFPALSFTNGTITIPTADTTALAFWGADRQVYILPSQFINQKYDIDQGVVKQDASPRRYDKDLSLDHLKPGDVFHFGPGGHLWISGDELEIMSRSLAHLRMEEDGTLRLGGRALQVQTNSYDDEVLFRVLEGDETSERRVVHYEIDPVKAEEGQAYAREMARLLNVTDDPDVFDVDYPDPRTPLLVERTGVLEDREGTVKRFGNGERVVKETVAGGVTIGIGEDGTVRIERDGLALEVTDDVKVTLPKGTVRLTRLVDRLDQLSAFAEIGGSLYET